MPTRSFDLNQVGALVQDYYLPVVRDQYFLSNAVYYRLQKRRKMYEGGRAIVAPLSFSPEGGGGQWWAGVDKLDTRVRDPIQAAVYFRKNFSVAVVLTRDEEDSVRGPEAIANLLTTKMNIARPTCVDGIGTELFNAGTDVRRLGGLGLALTSTPSSSHTYGTITTSSSSNAWWRNQANTTAYTTGGGAGTFAQVRGFGPIGKMWATIGRASGKKPTLILSNWGAYQDYHDSLAGPGGPASMSGGQRYQQDPDLARAGFENVYYKMAPWVVDERAPHDGSDVESVYFIHEPAVNLCVHSARNMSWDNWREPTDQKVRIGYIDWSGEFILTERRCHGVLSAVTTTATS